MGDWKSRSELKMGVLGTGRTLCPILYSCRSSGRGSEATEGHLSRCSMKSFASNGCCERPVNIWYSAHAKIEGESLSVLELSNRRVGEQPFRKA